MGGGQVYGDVPVQCAPVWCVPMYHGQWSHGIPPKLNDSHD